MSEYQFYFTVPNYRSVIGSTAWGGYSFQKSSTDNKVAVIGNGTCGVSSRTRASPYSVGNGSDNLEQAVGSDLMSRLKKRAHKGAGLRSA